MLIPCVKGERQCFPCEGDSSNPLANLSTERPDSLIWTSVQFRRTVNVIPNFWRRDTCVGFCESAISQTDADDCAARRAEECLTEPPLPPMPPEPPGSPPPVFCNQEVSCRSGSDCYTVPACTVFAATQSGANQIAQSLCDMRVHSNLASPCVPGGGGNGGGGNGGGGVTILYEKAWNTTATDNDSGRGAWTTSDPCPWPDDFASVWLDVNTNLCLCNGDDQDVYQWPFGEGTPADPDSMVVQSETTLDAVLDSYVLPNTPDYQNKGSVERLYLRRRVEGGASGKHVIMQAHWEKPGGAWIVGQWNGDTLSFDDLAAQSYCRLHISADPCAVYKFDTESTSQVLEVTSVPASGDITYEFDVPANGIYYACVWFEGRTHSNGPCTLHIETTITDL